MEEHEMKQAIVEAFDEVRSNLVGLRKKWENQLSGLVITGDSRIQKEMLEFSRFMDQVFDLADKVPLSIDKELATEAIQVEFVLLLMDVLTLIVEAENFDKARFLLGQVTDQALKAIMAQRFANKMIEAMNQKKKESEKLN